MKRLRKRLRKRCAVCEGMAWRRDRAGCVQCGGAHSEETIEADRTLQRREDPLVRY